MPNKKIKKRRRVVMTSDIVPAGSSEDALKQEPKNDEAAASDALTPSEENNGAEQAEGVAATNAPTNDENDETTEPSVPRGAVLSADERATDGESATADDGVTGESGSDSEPTTDGAAPRDASLAPDDDTTNGASAIDEASASDEITEPAAKQEELWTPEELEPPAVTVPAADVSRAHLKGLIEALVFVADQPLSLNDIAKAAGRADRKLVKALADELRQDYARRGIHLDEVAGGFIFRTNAAYAPFIRDAAAKKPVRMTRAQLETLAIIAYRQPLTRPEVDEVRGVDSGPVMKMLLERDLIKILGKKDEPGRPLLYGTTHAFLEFFGLKALKDLPSLREFTELNDDSRRVYDREMGDSPDAPTEPDLATLAAAASAAGSAPQPEGSIDSDAEPLTMRPTGETSSEWFERPTEPDTSVEALDATESDEPDTSVDALEPAESDEPDTSVDALEPTESDIEGSDQNGASSSSDSGEPEAQI